MSAAILLVDDNADDQALAMRALRRLEMDVSVHTANDGVEAVEALRKMLATPPDLMILDLKMPKLNGHEVLEWVRAQPGLGALSVIVFSSSDEPSDVDRALKLGAKQYLQKPVEYLLYIEAVQKAIRQWLSA